MEEKQSKTEEKSYEEGCYCGSKYHRYGYMEKQYMMIKSEKAEQRKLFIVYT